MSFLVYFLSPVISIKAVEYIHTGVSIDGWQSLTVVSLVLGGWNLLVRPVVGLLSLPVNILTLGLFGVVVNVGVVWLTAELVDGFTVGGPSGALLCAITIGFTNTLLREFIR